MHYFYPYKHLFADDWNAALRNAIPAVEGASDSVAFATSIAAQATHIHDSHVSTNARVLYNDVIGTIPTALRVRFIQDKLVITGIVADSVRARTGLNIGDVITAIDGQSVQARVALLSQYLVSSTPQALRNRLASSMLTGAQGSVARLTVRDSTGAERPVELRRSDMYYPLVIAKDRAGTSLFRILPGNIGYVDLDRLPVASVDSMFNALRDTKAIIFDDRGYPLGTAWAIAPRLNANPEPTPAASFRRLIVPSPDTADTYLFKFTQPIPPRGKASRYTGQTVMLINERTISQAEHTGLFFLAANGTKFIGSPTMGANGDVTSVVLPGRIAVSFTGHDVRFPNDKQLQRVGVQPDIPVSPTIAGIRAGRDEVLIAALKYLGASGDIPPDSGTDVLRPRAVLAPEPMFAGWMATAGTSSYRIGIDRSVKHSGTGAGHITAIEANPSNFAIVMQTIRADDFRGKRVRFSAYLRTQGAAGSGAGLWLRVDANGGAAALDNMSTRRVTRNTEWTRVECVLDVGDDAVGLAMGLLYGGPGEVWIDDVSLEIVGTDVPVTATDFQPRTNPANAASQRDMYAKYPARPANLDFERIR